ncbi:FG-GAP-like repeat-containing protein [Novosphingobium sp.]|uniref:FG-GAP-like repeat-containing protein n=1 Tax=Novosphingobium sp. TaxID=1874826 RepID=UPI002608C5CE|nr:FG-GAP-like repeat-containing protein [Novosphingobium sp.]
MPVINGTSGPDSLSGGIGVDTIYGGAGNDTITGGGDIDFLYGEDGDDVIGLDALLGGPGTTDNIYGGPGNDIIASLAADGNPTLDGGLGNDRIYAGVFGIGTTRFFTITAGDGNDQVVLGSGGGNQSAPASNPTATVQPLGQPNLVNLGAGDDLVVISSGQSVITLGSGRDTIRLGYFGPDGANGRVFDLPYTFQTNFITDFNPAEDVIETNGFGFTDGIVNPFSTGATALVQVGADVVLRSTSDGSPIGRGADYNLLVFRNQTLAGMAGVKFGEFSQDGSLPPGRTLTGTEGDDGSDSTVGVRLVGRLVGGAGSDTIRGLGGNDLVYGFGGNDALFGDDGNDTIYGGLGNDTVRGGLGDDIIVSNAEGDLLYGEGGNDTITLTVGRQLVPTLDPQFVNLDFRGPAALLDGGDGNDSLLVSFRVGATRTQSLVTVSGGNGDDQVVIGPVLFGADSAFEPNTISSPNSAPSLGLTIDVTLGAGRDTLTINQFVLGSAAPIIVRDFRPGEDTLNTSFLFENLPAGANPFATGYARLVQDGADTVLWLDRNGGGNNYRASVRFVGLTPANLQTTGLGQYNLSVAPLIGTPVTRGGTAGDDVMLPPDSASAGAFGTDGEYRYVGGAGNDTYLVDFRDIVVEAPGEGIDTINLVANRYGRGTSYVLPANFENLFTENAVASIIGNDLNNQIRAGGLTSGAPGVTIDGGLGADQITGGTGDDSLIGGSGDDYISGGDGRDTLVGGDGSDTLFGEGGDDSLSGGIGNDTQDGGNGNDVLNGGAGDDMLTGGAGNDTMDGGDGNDLYFVDSPNDVVAEQNSGGYDSVIAASSFTLGVGIESLQYDGTAGAQLGGNALNNRMIGGSGNDTFIGGVGDDELTGQRGIDEARWLNTTRAQATIDTSVFGLIRVGTSTEGFDSTRSVELFTFADGTYTFRFQDPGSTVLVRDFTTGAGGWTSQSRFPRQLADMNGDGVLDIVGFGTAGTLVSFGTGIGRFGPTTLVASNFGQNQGWTSGITFHRELADLNGDRKADIIGFGVNGTLVSLSGTNGYSTVTLGLNNFGQAQGWSSQEAFARAVGDVNGDGRIDLVGFGQAGTFVALGNGDGTFRPASFVLNNFGAAQGWTSNNTFHRTVADINGDGRADIVGFGAAGTLVALADGTGGFSAAILASTNFGQSAGWSSQDAFARQLGDINGDGRADIVGFGNTGTYVAFGLADGTFSKVGLDLANFSKSAGWSSNDLFPRELGDINGDGVVDIVGFGQFGVIAGLGYWADQII